MLSRAGAWSDFCMRLDTFAAETVNMQRGRSSERWFAVGILASLLLAITLTPALAQSEASQPQPEVDPLSTPIWAVALAPATLRSQPDTSADAFITLRPRAPVEILGYAGDWAYVYNPRGQGTAYVESDLLGPSDPPSQYATADAPPVEEQLDRQGRIQADTDVSFYPTTDPAAAYTQLTGGTSIEITGLLHDEDGTEWYRTAQDDYVPASAVSFATTPSAPIVTAAPSRTFAGHWVDVDLSLPARMTAYAGSTPVRSMLTIIGRGPLATPTGTFSIIRRVANETMDSSTVGIPRTSAGGYYLTNVLYTQYFLPTGQSIHYNWWSSNWGYPGSHGCLGLSYADAAYMWSFATTGTVVSIHY
jgi:L,D-transpeptidase catalytic domain